jgi:hypothetical protein
MANRNAFVICQVGDEDSEVRRRADEIFSFVVQPVTNEFELTANRSDRDPTPGQITAQIIRALTSASVVIADLTGRNPNVYYELGVAHSFGIPVVILVDAVDSLSFDTSQERVIEIGTGDQLGVAAAEKAKRKLRETLGVVLENGYIPSSLVSEAAGARSLQDLAPANPVATELAYVRDRLDLVVRQTARRGPEDTQWRSDARGLFNILKALAQSGQLNRSTLSRAGIELTEQPLSDDLIEALARDIPSPPVRAVSDDDIPF